MADEWRVTIDFDDEGDGTQFVEWLSALELENEERERLGERVIVSRDGPRVHLYADSEARAHRANVTVRARLEELAQSVRIAFERWHPVEQVWEDAAVPLPRTEEELEEEHERRQEREADESRRTGHAQWEVRVEFADHEETARLAERLEDEGVPLVRRHTFLLAGAANRDEADALAERLRREVAGRARVHVDPGGGVAWEVMPRNPFAVFGGLGG